ncbi:hypothetical protein B0T18DRAFT_153380 [Schizothecium vesticola]|uniref:SMP-30/Gluconolactonase/LRE-like region domain-containing protein n=1 Tax=Schizothecium vesticola TaxID=314040 RepID=A0AA40EVT7_9PEZI|nr:hypothetical protein B0T18DRAFT_153380 [Schizothecium vesticola]
MTTVTNTNIIENECVITLVNLLQVAPEKDPKARPLQPLSSETISITQYHQDLPLSLGPRQTFSLLLPTNKPFFLSSCGYNPTHDELYLCSDLLPRASPLENPTTLISKVTFSRRDETTNVITALQWNKLRVPPGMALPTSGAHCAEGILYATQAMFGSPDPSGLYHMPRGQRPRAVLTSYFGAPFDAPLGVAVREGDGSVWFADVGYGGAPRVYRFEPGTGELRVMAGPGGGLVRPLGVAVDGETVYVVDAGREEEEEKSPAVVYAFDIVERGAAPFLVNQRVFACPPGGRPRGIACDEKGSVFVCCQDGVEVFGKGGSLLGVIELPGGASSMTFGRQNEIFVCSGQCLWQVQLWAK